MYRRRHRGLFGEDGIHPGQHTRPASTHAFIALPAERRIQIEAVMGQGHRGARVIGPEIPSHRRIQDTDREPVRKPVSRVHLGHFARQRASRAHVEIEAVPTERADVPGGPPFRVDRRVGQGFPDPRRLVPDMPVDLHPSCIRWRHGLDPSVQVRPPVRGWPVAGRWRTPLPERFGPDNGPRA